MAFGLGLPALVELLASTVRSRVQVSPAATCVCVLFPTPSPWSGLMN